MTIIIRKKPSVLPGITNLSIAILERYGLKGPSTVVISIKNKANKKCLMYGLM
jgi:hypothetical protein